MNTSGSDRGGRPPPGSVFEADWLALREGVDHRSRSAELVEPLVREWPTGHVRRIVDLGSGTGSNVRYLAPRLPRPQAWVLVDQDRALLEAASLPPEAGEPVRMIGDLAKEGLEALAEADLCVAAALLDLVSEAWLERVIGACVRRGCGALFSSTYDGSIAWDGVAPDAADDLVLDLVNQHQTRDKGLGTALGPRAAFVARAGFERVGYRTWLVPSPWRLGPPDGPLAARLIRGWADAAVEQSPRDAAHIERWALARHDALTDPSFTLAVGHLDLLALPPLRGGDG